MLLLVFLNIMCTIIIIVCSHIFDSQCTAVLDKCDQVHAELLSLRVALDRRAPKNEKASHNQ